MRGLPPRDERLGKWAACLTVLVESHNVWVDWLYETVGCGYTCVEYTMRVGGVPLIRRESMIDKWVECPVST